MSETPTPPQVTGQMYLYNKPELLNPEQHKGLGVNKIERPFQFAATARALPLTVSEIAAASHDYPIVFASLESPVPLAVVGIIDDANLFVSEGGQWEEHRYIPGYVRRYPFGAATETGGERFAVVIDSEYPGLSEGGETQLFEGTEPTKFTSDAVDFTRRYEEDRQMTNQFIDMMKEMNILSGQTAQYTPTTGGDQVSFAQYVGFDENALKELDDEKFKQLRTAGVLPIIYSQLLSRTHWRGLVSRRAARFNLTEENVFQPLKLS